jgi:hypothetical protein
MYVAGSAGRLTSRACASRIVANAPSSLATDPAISATSTSAFSGSSRAVEKPSRTSIRPAGTSVAWRMAARARRAASRFASIVYTFLAPARAAASASSAYGPVPRSSTTSVRSGAAASRRRMASTKRGVRRSSSRIAAYAPSSNEMNDASPLKPSVAVQVARSVGEPEMAALAGERSGGSRAAALPAPRSAARREIVGSLQVGGSARGVAVSAMRSAEGVNVGGRMREISFSSVVCGLFCGL